MTRGAKSPLQQPVPAAAAIAARRKNERLQIASSQVPIRNSTSGENYLGEELRPYAARPGALDAFALPSLHSGRRTHLPLHKPREGGDR